MTEQPRFGEQRLVRQEASIRLMYRLMGIADPSHYLHSRYFQIALSSLPDFHPRNVLDAGCGSGDYSFFLARRYPEAQVLGVDIDASLIQRCRETAQELGIANVDFEVADLARLGMSASFDLLVSIDVLEHIAEQQQALGSLARSLRPGGFAFFHIPTVRQRPVPFSARLGDFHEWAEEEHVAGLGTAEEFIAAVETAGLSVVAEARTFGYWTGELANSLFNLPYRNTLRNRVLQAAVAPICRALALADSLALDGTRYAARVLATKAAPQPGYS